MASAMALDPLSARQRASPTSWTPSYTLVGIARRTSSRQPFNTSTPFAWATLTRLRHESGFSFHIGPFPPPRPGTDNRLPERGSNQLHRDRRHPDLHPRLH